MTSKIFFSVIIPNYNQANYLKKAISSVLKQSFDNFEIIVIDNNSSDNSKKIVNSFQSSKIRLFNINNQGIISKSRNFGILKSNSEWICFLDADDYWFKNKLLETKKIIEENKFIDVICNGEIYFFYDFKKFKKKIYKKKNKNLNMFHSLLLYGNQLSTSATSVKKKFIRDNEIFFSEDQSIKTSEDYDYWLQLAYKKANFKFIKKCLGVWLIHEKSTSNQFNNHNRAYLNVSLNNIEKSRFNIKLKKFLKKYLYFKYYLISFKQNFSHRNYFKSFKFLTKILLNFYFIFTFFKIKKK